MSHYPDCECERWRDGATRCPVHNTRKAATNTREAIEEYGQLYSGGAVLLWNLAEHVLRIYPLAQQIEHGQRNGGKVLRRRVIVVEDWSEVDG